MFACLVYIILCACTYTYTSKHVHTPDTPPYTINHNVHLHACPPYHPYVHRSGCWLICWIRPTTDSLPAPPPPHTPHTPPPQRKKMWRQSGTSRHCFEQFDSNHFRFACVFIIDYSIMHVNGYTLKSSLQG